MMTSRPIQLIKRHYQVAARNGHSEVVKLLLTRGDIEINTKKSWRDRTPLSWAAGNGHSEVVKLLLAHDGIRSI